MQNSGYRACAGGFKLVRVLFGSALAVLLGWCPVAMAQWTTQTNTLKAGWNAVYLHVDASYATLDDLVGDDLANPIEEIWYWRPATTGGQFVDSPQIPTDTGSQWQTWEKVTGANSALQRLVPNGAYLVKVAANVASYNWLVKGKPVAPTFKWTLSGLNFVGFPTAPSTPPTFDAFFAPAPELKQNSEVYRYPGGELGQGNPLRVVALRTTPVRRDQAYWVRAGDAYNKYFGPFEIVQGGETGIRFGDSRGQSKFRLRNLANVPVTVTLKEIASETPPAGQPAIQAVPPLLLRGSVNTTNLTFAYQNLTTASKQWTLAAAGKVGSEVEVVIGLNRSEMPGPPGALFAGILRFTDSLGFSQVDVAVSAEKASTAGLWVGGASVSYVSHYLKPYARATNDAALAALLDRLQLGQGVSGYRYERDPNSGRVLVFGGPEGKTGSYLLDGPIKVDSGNVASPFPLRLILHNDGTQTRLLQKVFHGVGLSSNIIVSTRENLLLPAGQGDARRISAVHLPVSEMNDPWNCTGVMRQGQSLTVTVPTAFDDQSSNPFLHTYHPDHDNLDAQFKTKLPRGAESYEVTRQLTLSFKSPDDDFNALTQGSQDLEGSYAEVVTFAGRGSQTRQYNALGSFTLKRISDIATLTTQ